MRLPGSVQEIADVIGRERALYLIGQLPRCKVRDPRFAATWKQQVVMYVPKQLTPDHPLAKILEFSEAEKLVRAFGGEIMKPAGCGEVYRAFRDRSIRRMYSEGMPAREIAELMEISERQVRNLVAEITPKDARADNDNTPAKSVTRAAGMKRKRKEVRG